MLALLNFHVQNYRLNMVSVNTLQKRICHMWNKVAILWYQIQIIQFYSYAPVAVWVIKVIHRNEPIHHILDTFKGTDEGTNE